MNIVLCNAKGGAGKTTLCVLLAEALAQAGRRVALRDLDSQYTARAWLHSRGSNGLAWRTRTNLIV